MNLIITSVLDLYEQILALAIVDALNLWAHPKYVHFLQEEKPGKLDEEWFKWFAGEWSVARTIRTEKRRFIVRYLDYEFRKGIASDRSGAEVDRAAGYLQSKKWTSQTRKDGSSSLPLSLVSKIGFFFDPDNLIPYDSFARRGLNKLRGTTRQGGEGHFKDGMSYCKYLKMFNEKFILARTSIAHELDEEWVGALAKKLDCHPKYLSMIRFQRKVFDNYLVHFGGKEYSWESSA